MAQRSAKARHAPPFSVSPASTTRIIGLLKTPRVALIHNAFPHEDAAALMWQSVPSYRCLSGCMRAQAGHVLAGGERCAHWR